MFLIKNVWREKSILLAIIFVICTSACSQPGSDDSNSLEVLASPVGGTFNSPQLVTLTANKPGTIYYTLNGETPTTSSLIYANRIGINNSITLKFIIIDKKGNSSNIMEEYYSITWDVPPTIIYRSNEDISDLKITLDSMNIIHAVWITGEGYSDPIYYSNSANWTAETRIINYGNDPVIEIDSKNLVHLAFIFRILPWFAKIYYSNSINWDFCTDISKNHQITAHHALPSLAIDSSNVVHTVWKFRPDQLGKEKETGIYYANSTDWAPPKVLFQGPVVTFSPSIKIDSKNIKHIVWANRLSYYNHLQEICYMNSLDWNNHSVITQNSLEYNYPSMAVGPDDIIHVTWIDGTDRNVYYANSKNWSEQINISGPDSYMSTIAVDNLNIVHIAWRHGHLTNPSILYANSLNWSNHTTISDVGTPDGLNLQVDANNIIHIAWESYENSAGIINIKP